MLRSRQRHKPLELARGGVTFESDDRFDGNFRLAEAIAP
jgi:hypothetical protein